MCHAHVGNSRSRAGLRRRSISSSSPWRISVPDHATYVVSGLLLQSVERVDVVFVQVIEVEFKFLALLRRQVQTVEVHQHLLSAA